MLGNRMLRLVSGSIAARIALACVLPLIGLALFAGSMVIEALSLDDAIEVARACPTYEFDGSVEVRPVQDHRSW